MKTTIAHRIFLLSPAYAGGERARMILSEHAHLDLAKKMRSKQGAPIGEVLAFLSGLYFRGKIAYANAVAGAIVNGTRPPKLAPGRSPKESTDKSGV